VIFFATCLKLFDSSPEDATFAAAFAWLFLAFAMISLSSLSLSSLSWSKATAVSTWALPRWQWSFAEAAVLSFTHKQSVLSIPSPNFLPASAHWADHPSYPLCTLSLREEGYWQVMRWSALWATRHRALGCLGVALRCGVGLAGDNSNRVIFHICQIDSLYVSSGQFSFTSKTLIMYFLVYAAALANVTSLYERVRVEYRAI